jgi:hypothetical protein
MSGGSSRGKGKEGTKGTPIVWEGSLDPEDFDESVYHFPIETKRDFTKQCPLRGYDNRKEDWPKCRHDKDCLVQMFMEGLDRGRRFFKCPRVEVIGFKILYSNFFLHCFASYRPN